MGKRRRNKSRKRSLVFQESPVERGQPCPSPVLGVDNPITAVSVPVADSDLSWISPQFNGITASHGKRRQARRPPSAKKGTGRSRRAGLGVSLNKVNLGSSRLKSRHHSNTRFHPLNFVDGGPSRQFRKSSPCEELNVTEDDGRDGKQCRRSGRLSVEHRESVQSSMKTRNRSGNSSVNNPEKSVVRGDVKENNNDVGDEREEDGDGFDEVERARRRHTVLRHSEEYDRRISVAPPCDRGGRNKVLGRWISPQAAAVKQQHLGFRQYSSSQESQHLGCDDNADLTPTNCRAETPQSLSRGLHGKATHHRRVSNHSDILLSPVDVCVMFNESVSRPGLIGHRECMPSCRNLLTDSPIGDESYNPEVGRNLQNGDGMCSATKNLSQIETVQCPSVLEWINEQSAEQRTAFDDGQNVSQSQRRVKKKQIESLEVRPHGGPRRSKRLQEQHLQALKCLFPQTPPTPISRNVRILVADTPESQYGMTNRQRQLIGLY